MLGMKKQPIEQPVVVEQPTEAELRRQVRDAGLVVSRINYHDIHAPNHWCVFRRRDGERLTDPFPSEAEAWQSVPEVLAELTLARETAIREEAERQENYRRCAIEAHLRQSHIPDGLQNISLEDFQPTEPVLIARGFVRNFANRIEDGKGLIFAGSGTQKLKLACAVLEAVARDRHSVRYATVKDVAWCLALPATRIPELANPDLLVINWSGIQEQDEATRAEIVEAVVTVMLETRPTRPTVLLIDGSIDLFTQLVQGILSEPNTADRWLGIHRRNDIVVFSAKEGK